ncbi:MAG TPA: hypothetical protein VHQ65_07760 [Thermoanaerobaculia bacterium]|nr:hypothetical protein [Thermoanaerobaculia bacterium]
MNILHALEDPALFGSLPAFRDLDTWRPWLVFLRAVYGLPLDAGDLELFRQHTGRREPRAGGYPEAALVVGRQSGKSRVAALVGVFEAARALAAGERGVYVPLIAQDLRGAQRALYGYVAEAVQGSGLLRREVTRETSTELELAGAVTLGVYPCRPAGVRGVRAACAVVDELAFFTATDGRPQDVEMLRAIRPALSTTGGRLLILSSPYAQAGALYDLHRRHFGRDDSPTLVWQATAPQMNPTLPRDYLARMEAEDPDAYRSEVLGEFRAGVSAFLEPDALAAVVEAGVRERRPVAGARYVGFVDAASGSGKDAFGLGIAHRDGERAVLDVCRAWQPPFNPSGVIAEAAALLHRYRLARVEGDRYAPGFVEEGFRRHRVTYRPSDRTTSELYLELLPLVNAAAVVLLDDPHLLRELRGLERRRGTAGRDRVDHRRGGHDDRAVAAAGALAAASHGPKVISAVWGSARMQPTVSPPPRVARRLPRRRPVLVKATEATADRLILDRLAFARDLARRASPTGPSAVDQLLARSFGFEDR